MQAIYPELVLLSGNGQNTGPRGKVSILVNLVNPITLVCQDRTGESYSEVNHLPPLTLYFELPQGYPESQPPVFEVTSTWLPHRLVQRLVLTLSRLWQGAGDQVLYTALDTLYEQAETGFGVTESSTLVLNLSNNSALKKELQKYDLLSAQKSFNDQTFKCVICQDSHKGSACTKLNNCQHVFCTKCLNTFLTAYINEGTIANIKCPDLNCSQPEISFSDILLLAGEALANRYKQLQLQRNPNSITCPRSMCQALMLPGKDELVICKSCKYAFCRMCQKSWHGYHNRCVFRDDVSLETAKAYHLGTDMDKLALEKVFNRSALVAKVKVWLDEVEFEQAAKDQDIKQCPFCHSFVSREAGCNLVQCLCGGKFCFACMKKFSPEHANPLGYYKVWRCCKKLFVEAEGTEADIA